MPLIYPGGVSKEAKGGEAYHFNGDSSTKKTVKSLEHSWQCQFSVDSEKAPYLFPVCIFVFVLGSYYFPLPHHSSLLIPTQNFLPSFFFFFNFLAN